MMLYARILLTIALVLITGLFISSCGSSSTKTETIDLQGTVLLESETDHSGITVALYNVLTDDDLTAIQQEYSGIGCSVSANDLFDHRFATPLYTTTTAADGSFSFADIDGSKFNVVLYKSGYGFKYLLNYTLSSRSTWPSNIVLYPEVVMGGTYSSGYTFLADRHYVFSQNTYLSGGQSYVIEPGACLRISAGKTLEVHAPVTLQGTSGNMFRITSDANLDSFAQGLDTSTINLFYKFYITNEATVQDGLIEWGWFSLGNMGLIINNDGLTLQNSVIQSCVNGAIFNMVNTANCNHLLVYQNNRSTSVGISYELVPDGNFSYNCLLKNTTGYLEQPAYLGTLADNIFQGNQNGMICNQSIGEINNNEFYENTNSDILFSMNETTNEYEYYLHHNIFGSSTSLKSRGVGSFLTVRPIRINNNNFLSDTWFMTFHSNSNWHVLTVDATENYWDGLDTAEAIKARINDADDYVELTYPEVDVSNFYYSPFSNIGIR